MIIYLYSMFEYIGSSWPQPSILFKKHKHKHTRFAEHQFSYFLWVPKKKQKKKTKRETKHGKLMWKGKTPMSTYSLFFYLYICALKQNEKCLCAGICAVQFWLNSSCIHCGTYLVLGEQKAGEQHKPNWKKVKNFASNWSELMWKKLWRWSENRDVWPFMFFFSCFRFLFASFSCFLLFYLWLQLLFLRHWRHHNILYIGFTYLVRDTFIFSAIITCWFHDISWTYARRRRRRRWWQLYIGLGRVEV